VVVVLVGRRQQLRRRGGRRRLRGLRVVTNPIDLPGAEFLAFYIALSAVVLLGFEAWWEVSSRGGAPDELPADPYLLAYLRGGREEAVRVALLALIEQGAVTVDRTILAGVERDPRFRRVPLESELLASLGRPRPFRGLVENGDGGPACAAYQAQLEAAGYVRSERAMAAGKAVHAALVTFLAAVAAVKLIVALSRGRTNVGFLVGLAIVVLTIGARRRLSLTTRRGRRALAAVQGLLRGARDRITSLGRGALADELLVVAGAFGLGVLPVVDFAFVTTLGARPPVPVSTADSSSGSSCGGGGSSCSSGGSSCGGGGCGGGCGGCGS
jgi:uncharacterized protein (TIGR04222 family)